MNECLMKLRQRQWRDDPERKGMFDLEEMEDRTNEE
jgi:hypothetical protein